MAISLMVSTISCNCLGSRNRITCYYRLIGTGTYGYDLFCSDEPKFYLEGSLVLGLVVDTKSYGASNIILLLLFLTNQ